MDDAMLINKVFFGDCRDSMRKLIADGVKVQTCITSPPYYGLRDYGHDGQIGQEETPGEYVVTLVEVFSLVWDLLADDGVLWVNLGDSYAGSNRGVCADGSVAAGEKQRTNKGTTQGILKKDNSQIAPKNLIGIPWRVAFALQDADWYLRQDIIWSKPNAMPESVKDRCTKAHEYVFMLTKNQHYFFDSNAMLEPANYDGRKDTMMKGSDKYESGFVPGQSEQSFHSRGHERWREVDGVKVRTRRSVWTVPTNPYSGAHFAVFPPALIEPMVLASTRIGDIVLDPFMGSGTTAQVAQDLGRN